MKPSWPSIEEAVSSRRKAIGHGASVGFIDHVSVALFDRVAELDAQLQATREHALPLTPTPYAGPATGNDLVDRLRGIYVVPVVGERRFDASSINLEAAGRIVELERDRDELLALLGTNEEHRRRARIEQAGKGRTTP